MISTVNALFGDHAVLLAQVPILRSAVVNTAFGVFSQVSGDEVQLEAVRVLPPRLVMISSTAAVIWVRTCW